MKIYILRRSDFPSKDFFGHLEKGTKYYQNYDFGRAIEEWRAASRTNATGSVHLQKIDGKVFFGSIIEEVPVLLFLYAVHINELSGVGLLKSEGVSKRLVFTSGNVVFATTSKKEKRIGSFILGRRKLLPDQLERLAGEAKNQGRRLGDYLVERGVLASKDLKELLTLQVQEILGEVFFWQKGQLYFAEKEVDEEPVVNYTPLKAALIAAQRGYNFARFKKEIPSKTVIFRPSPYVEKDREKIMEGLNANEEFVLSLIDGVRNVDQLIKFSGTDEVSLMNILYRLSAVGLIRRTKEVGEYEDKEFKELSTLIKVFFDIHRLIVTSLLKEIGDRGKNIIIKAKSSLKPDYRVIFSNVPLDEADKLRREPILRNTASYFPNPEQRTIFMEAFHDLFVNMLDESRKFLGDGIVKETVKGIERIKADFETFSVNSTMKNRALEVLDNIVTKYT